jgi:hypothetical protein
VGVSPLESIGENECLEGIPVSAELMEHELESLEMLVDVVSAENVEQAPVSVDERCDVDEEDPGVDMRKTRALARRTKARSMSTGASGDSDQECLAVLMQLDASDGEVRCSFMRGAYVTFSYLSVAGRGCRSSDFHRQQSDGIFAHFFKAAFSVSRVYWSLGRRR